MHNLAEIFPLDSIKVYKLFINIYMYYYFNPTRSLRGGQGRGGINIIIIIIINIILIFSTIIIINITTIVGSLSSHVKSSSYKSS